MEKYTDITKTGPVALKGLPGLNRQGDFEKLILSGSGNMQRSLTPSTSKNVGLELASQGYGDSSYDEDIQFENQAENLNEVRAIEQPWYSQIGAGLAKGAVLAGTTFLDGTIGLVLGAAKGIQNLFDDNPSTGFLSGLWDNDFSKAMQDVNKLSEKSLPNYYTHDEQEQPWYENFFTANFLGDKFLKNLGFTVGAYYSGLIGSGLLKGGITALQSTKKGAEAFNTAAKLAKTIGIVREASDFPAFVTSSVGATISAVNEGRIEALNNSNDWFEHQKAQLDSQHKKRLQNISNTYGDTEIAEQLIESENKAYTSSLGKLSEDRIHMGNADLLMNIPILTASNIIQFGKMYANGFKTARKTTNIVGRAGEYTAGTTKLGAATAITKGALSEGNEEILQSAASNISGNYYATDVNNFYKARTNQEAAQETLDWAKSFAEGINKTVNDGSSWEEFFIGSLTGALGMPRFRGIRSESGSLQSPITIEGGAIGEWRDYRNKIARENEIANYMNDRVNSPEFKNYYQGLVRHNKYQNDMNRATEEGDEFNFKNAEHAQLVSDIAMFDNAGKMEDLTTLIDAAFDTSDENLASIVKNTTTTLEDGSKVGPFVDKNGNPMYATPEGKQKMIEKLQQNHDEMTNTIDNYLKIKDELDIKVGQKLSDDQLEELTWMKSQIDNWSERATAMSGEVKSAIGNVIGNLDSLLRFNQQVRDFEGKQTRKDDKGNIDASLSERYLQADKNVRAIQGEINTLNLVRGQDDKTLAYTLAANPKFVDGLIKDINEVDETVLSADEKEDITTKLNDIVKLGNASKTYNAKLKEYLDNPQKQAEDHAKADKQNIDKNAEITRAKQVEALNKTVNFQEVESLINNGEATLDDLDSSSSDAARSYKKASLFKKKATELITSSDSEHKSELLDMLNRRFNENATYDDLSDEALVTELPLEATTWDEKAQESLESEFNEILKSARDKVNSGNSQKQDVEAKKTGVKKPDNVGKDDVAQPPGNKPFSIDETIKKIDKLNIAPGAETEVKALTNQIAKDIEKLSKSKDPKLIRQTQRNVNALSNLVGNDVIADIIDRVRELSKPDIFNPSSPEEVLREAEAEMDRFKPTAVTGVLKAVIPQFDLDAKRDGVLIDFVGDDRNQGYSYVYSKLKEVDPKKNRSMEANTDTFVEPVFDEANSDGKVYILLPNSKGTLSPKKVYIRHLNKTEFDLATQNDPIANDLKKAFNDLASIANLEKGFDEALDNVYMDLVELLYIPDSFHINIISRANDVSLQIAFTDREGKRQNRNILLKRFAKKSLLNIGAGTTQASEPYTAPVEEVYNQVLDAFYEANLAFNVDAKKLTGKKGQEYANRLRDSNILATYLTGKRMQGTWFLLNEKPNTTHTDSAFERAKASQQAKGGTRVQYGGKEYFVRNGIIFDQSGSIVDLGDNAQQVKDLAYINSAYGTSYFGVNQHDGKVLIVDRNGKRGYNRATNKYLSPKEVEELEAILDGRKSKASQTAIAVQSLQDSQKLVLRDDNGNPDTSSGYYMIKEEDGQYHKYQRVHSTIGSNYIGPSKGDAATSRGSLVDEVARQFLIDPNVTKPEGMSDEAFGALKRGLGKFRDDANRRGLKLVTDRTVVFHKYSDGRRIAGELDVFAYNPSTGEVMIFDFKTSKYSVRDTAFSRVTNPRLFTRSNKDQYTLQLSAYAKLFEDSFGVPVHNLIIVPFQLKYSREKGGGIARIFPEDYVSLTYQNSVFERTDKAPASQSPVLLRTVKGQYVTMGKGKPEYHQADMQVLFTTSNNQTFYLAKVGDGYKLVLPNGRSMTIDPSLVSDEEGRTRNNIMDFIQADNVVAAIQDAMSSTPLENSPYGNSIELKKTPKEAPKPDDRMKRGLDALDRLNSLKPTTPTQQAPNQGAINKRERDEKATVAIDLSTALGRSQLARKKWGEITDAEKAIISPMFEGMKEKDIQEYWDGTDATQRESFIPACK